MDILCSKSMTILAQNKYNENTIHKECFCVYVLFLKSSFDSGSSDAPSLAQATSLRNTEKTLADSLKCHHPNVRFAWHIGSLLLKMVNGCICFKSVSPDHEDVSKCYLSEESFNTVSLKT